jgi:hypothetical protein
MEKLCNGAGEKEALEGVGDEEMLERQGGTAESNRNPDLMMMIKELSHVLLVSNNHIIIFKGHGEL